MSDPLTGYVRVKAVCLFINAGRVLAIDGFDPAKPHRQHRFWVPIGGRVEMGETSSEAIVREVREELSTGISDLELLGVLENLFTFDGGEGHEIVFVYDARFVDASIYDNDEVPGVEEGRPFTASWIDPSAPSNDWPLYPEGLLGLIENQP
ncbi:MAG: NUDIX hydrolase, partial [Actinomycetota bacterium]